MAGATSRNVFTLKIRIISFQLTFIILVLELFINISLFRIMFLLELWFIMLLFDPSR